MSNFRLPYKMFSGDFLLSHKSVYSVPINFGARFKSEQKPGSVFVHLFFTADYF
jgi:hypothetical protein